MPKSLVIRKDGLDGLQKGVRALTKNEVLVGIPAANADRQPEPGETEPATNALIGYVQEFGSPARNIPPRPFLIPGIEGVRDKIAAQMKATGQQALEASSPERAATIVDQGMHATGLVAQSAVQQRITEGPFAPLSERTLAARRARGRTGDKPLQDTGQLRRAITYVVRPKGQNDG